MDDAVTSGGTWLKSGTEGILFRMNHSEWGDPLQIMSISSAPLFTKETSNHSLNGLPNEH
jgi:hypothetical protein